MPSSQPATPRRARLQGRVRQKTFEYTLPTCKVEETEDLMPLIVSSDHPGHECVSVKHTGSLPSHEQHITNYTTGLSSQLNLFTPVSNFPSRTLPPPGIRARNLDGLNSMTFKVGDKVMVRRFQESLNDWTDWRQGIVVEQGGIRGYIGTFAREYIARTTCSVTGEVILSRHMPFLWEIWPMRLQLPNVQPEECIRRKQKISNVYARINIPGSLNGAPFDRIWAPASVMEWEPGDPYKITVRFLAGPFVGEVHKVEDILPYTRETSVACRRQGYFVTRVSDGQLAPPLTL